MSVDDPIITDEKCSGCGGKKVRQGIDLCCVRCNGRGRTEEMMEWYRTYVLFCKAEAQKYNLEHPEATLEEILQHIDYVLFTSVCKTWDDYDDILAALNHKSIGEPFKLSQSNR